MLLPTSPPPPRRWVKDASVTGSSRLADVPQLIHPDDLGMPTYFVGSRPARVGLCAVVRPIGHVQSPLHPGGGDPKTTT